MIWNLCICGKDEECNELKQKICVYIQKIGIKADIMVFYSIDDIILTTNRFDVIFLDILLRNNPKIDTLFFEQNRKKPILLFFTSSLDKSKKRKYDFCFMLKSTTHSTLEITLNNLLSYDEEQTVLIHNSSNQIRLNLDDIMYIEANNKEIGIRTYNDFITVKETLSEIENKINSAQFYKPHRSYLVNMKYIKAFNRKCIIMYNDEKISISRLKKDEFIEKFYTYLNVKGNCNHTK